MSSLDPHKDNSSTIPSTPKQYLHHQHSISISNDINSEGSETMASTINLFDYPSGQISMTSGSGMADESSYRNIQRQQSLLPKKWLRENVMSYEGNYITKEPLLEELPNHHYLQNHQIPSSSYSSQTTGISDKDKWIGIAFKIIMALYVIIGLYCWIKSPSLPSSRLYQSLVASSSKFLSLSIISIVIGMIWLWLISRFTTVIVYAMSLFIPVGGIMSGFWFFKEAIHHHSWTLLAGGLLISSLGVWWSWLILFTNRLGNQRAIIQVFKIAAQVLDAKKKNIYFSSGAIMIGYILYLWIWMFLFERIVTFGSRWLMAYSLFVFLWGSSMASILQKSTVSNIICNWYFAANNEYSPPIIMGNLIFTITRRFGTISMASLILTFIRLWRLSIQGYRWISNVILPTWLRNGINSLTIISNFIDRLLEHLNDYAIYYSSFTGDDFCSSGRAVVKIFRRTMILGLSTSKSFSFIHSFIYLFFIFQFNNL